MAEIAAPRAVRTDTPLGVILAHLEVPDCRCPLVKLCRRPDPSECPGESRCRECPALHDLNNPCEHFEALLERWPEDLTLEDWLALMREYDPEGMADRPQAPEGTVAVTQRARVALYEERARAGLALFHPADLVDGDLLEGVAVEARPGKLEGEIVTSKARVDPPKPPGPEESLTGLDLSPMATGSQTDDDDGDGNDPDGQQQQAATTEKKRQGKKRKRRHHR